MKAHLPLLWCLALVCVSCRSLEEKRALAIGRIELAAEKYGALLPGIDRVQLFRLDSPMNRSEGAFSVAYDPSSYSVTQQCQVMGPDAEKIAARWRRIPFHWAVSALCHEPGLGVRFFAESKLVFETTICFKCSNFRVPVSDETPLCGFYLDSARTGEFSNIVEQAFSASGSK
jgi:hypothetical protein